MFGNNVPLGRSESEIKKNFLYSLYNKVKDFYF